MDIEQKIEKSVLVCFAENGFYFIDTCPGVPLEKQAKDTGELNAHLIRIETPFQRVLWERSLILDAEILIPSNSR